MHILKMLENHSDYNLTDFNNFINESVPYQRHVPEPPTYLLVVVTIFYILIFILGVFGNIIVILVIVFNKNMRSTVNMFLVNLCVADLLVMVICMPPTLVELHFKEIWYLGEFMCKLVPFLEFVVSSASVFTILIISIERFRVVCHPLSTTTESTKQFAKAIIMIWILAVITSAPILPIIVYKKSMLMDGTPVTVCRIPVRRDWQKTFFITNAIIIYFVPCLILCVLYFILCKQLVPRKDGDDTVDLREYSSNDKRRLRWQVINIIVTIVSVFFICYFPYRVVSIWMMLASSSTLEKMGLETYLNIVYSARLLLYVNHALNPIIYNFVSTKFRMALGLFLSRSRGFSSSDRRRSLGGVKLRASNNSIRFKANSNRENGENESKASSSNASYHGKRNDFTPLYARLHHMDNDEEVLCINEMVQNYNELNQNDKLIANNLQMNIKTMKPGITVHLETKEGYVLAITVKKLGSPEIIDNRENTEL